MAGCQKLIDFIIIDFPKRFFMKKIQSFTVRMAFLFVLIQFSGCQKFIDRIFPGHTNNDYTGCRIKHITSQLSTGEGDEEVIATVEYNDANNPISFLYNKERGYYLSLRYMYYDSNNRLVDYKVMYDTSLEIEDHRYGYSGDRIITDTGTFRLTGYIVVLSTFEYDSKGRIVVENRKVIDTEGSPDSWPSVDPIFYQYDSNDNLVIEGDYSYDNKVNFRRTNKVWMFILRNYSQNNLQGATDYNERGLPVRFSGSPDHLFYTGLISIDYGCE